LASPEHRVKVSLRSNLTLPRLALVDPKLTHSVPPQITASTGLDALTQVIEPYVSRLANPLTDAICREGIRRGARSLRRAYEDGGDANARENMALTSLFGGLALANAKLGAVHGFAGPLGGMFHAPHGAICGRLLPYVMAVNVQALRERGQGGAALRRYDEVAQLLVGSPRAAAHDGVSWMQALCAALDIPPLSAHGVTEDDFPAIVEKAARSSSMKGNPIELTREEMEEILRRAL
jgi:alcohol dehydrogenase class IV